MQTEKNKQFSRRGLMGKTLAGVAGLLAAKVLSAQESCGLTPEQTEGPFYPIADRLDKDNDLTFITNKPGQAKGEVIFIKGVVLNQHCVPVKGALVEIWQACESGKYDHPGDNNSAKLDPNFQYWGRAITNQKGEYLFKTIKPGAYPANSTWTRPPHIHFKVHLRGHQELTSQLYFAGEPLNQNDLVLRETPAEERQRLIVTLRPELDQNGKKITVGIFNINLNSL